jgi:protein-disulfide isomerase
MARSRQRLGQGLRQESRSFREMMWRYAWVILILAGLSPATWAEAVAVPSAASMPPAEQRTAAEKAELARLLEIARQAKPASRKYSAELDISGHPYVGSTDAPLVMIEFGSYQCGFCRKHFATTFPELKSTYVDSGQLRYVFFDMALDKRHTHASKAAEAAHCANEQGRFLAYRSALFGSKRVAAEFLPEHAAEVGLDTADFMRCLDSERYRAQPEADRALGRKLRVRGTPSFFLGRLDADGERVTVVRRIGGARPYALFSEQIDTLYAGVVAQDESELSAVTPEDRPL